MKKFLILLIPLFSGCTYAMEKPQTVRIEKKPQLTAEQQIILNDQLMDELLLVERVRIRGDKTSSQQKMQQKMNIKKLIDRGADVNSEWNSTPALFYVVNTHDIEMVQWFLDHGANINALNYSKQNVLPSYLGKGYGYEIAIIKLLLAHGLTINSADCIGQTLLMYAAEYGQSEVVKLLLEHGADINIQNARGQTALMCAAKRGIPETIRLLSEAAPLRQLKELRAAQKAQSYLGLLPEELLQLTTQYIRIVDPNITDSVGKTALNHAIENLEFVIEHGHSVWYQNTDQEIRDIEEVINMLEPITAKR